MTTKHSIIIELNPRDFIFIMKNPEIKYERLPMEEPDVDRILIWLVGVKTIPLRPFLYYFDDTTGFYQDGYLCLNPRLWYINTGGYFRIGTEGNPVKTRYEKVQKILDDIIDDPNWEKITFKEEKVE